MNAILPTALIESAFDTGSTNRPGWGRRRDGWTPDRIRTFLNALAQCGAVADAARVAGMSKQSAYAFRNSARGRGFDAAWRAALLLSRGHCADDVRPRAVDGGIGRDGRSRGGPRRHDRSRAMYAHLVDQAASMLGAHRAGQPVDREFEAFVDAVCTYYRAGEGG